MIPEFEQGMRAMLVERKDAPGLLGVAVAGARFVVALPQGYNGKTTICIAPNGTVIVAHPELPPLLVDASRGTYQLIEGHHIDAEAGRHRLRTH